MGEFFRCTLGYVNPFLYIICSHFGSFGSSTLPAPGEHSALRSRVTHLRQYRVRRLSASLPLRVPLSLLRALHIGILDAAMTPDGSALQWILMEGDGMQLSLTLSGSGASARRREMAELLDLDSRREITDLVRDLLRRRRAESRGAQPVSPGFPQAIPAECQHPTAATPLPAPAAASSGTSPTAQPVSQDFRLAIDEDFTATSLPARAPAHSVSTKRVVRAHQLGTQWMAFIEGSGPHPGPSPPFPGGQRLSNTVHVVLRGGGRDNYDGPTLHGHKFTTVMLQKGERCISIGYMDRTRAVTGENNMDANAVLNGFPLCAEAYGFLAGAGRTTCTDLRRLHLPRHGLPLVSLPIPDLGLVDNSHC